MNIDLGNLTPASMALQGRLVGQGFFLGSPFPAMVEMMAVQARSGAVFWLLTLIVWTVPVWPLVGRTAVGADVRAPTPTPPDMSAESRTATARAGRSRGFEEG